MAIFGIITLGIYLIFWWYFVNREMADYGRAKGTDELGTSPGLSVLAATLGWLVIVPGVMTTINTFKRAQKTQSLAGEAPRDQRLARADPLHRHLPGLPRLRSERPQLRLEARGRRLDGNFRLAKGGIREGRSQIPVGES